MIISKYGAQQTISRIADMFKKRNDNGLLQFGNKEPEMLFDMSKRMMPVKPQMLWSISPIKLLLPRFKVHRFRLGRDHSKTSSLPDNLLQWKSIVPAYVYKTPR
jgi:hypothetical protein